MRSLALAILLLTFGPPALHAGGDAPWDPIPPEAWALKKEDVKGAGAVFLLKSMRVSDSGITYQLRIRILAEEGRGAAELKAFPANVADLRGRTVLRSGQEVPFLSQKDFQIKESVSAYDAKLKRTVVVPPGVTSDCIVDVSWREPADYGRLAYFMTSELFVVDLQEDYPIRTLQVEVAHGFSLSWTQTAFPARTWGEKQLDRFRAFTYSEVPPFEHEPFSALGFCSRGRFLMYSVPLFLGVEYRKGGTAYWDAAMGTGLKSYLTEGHKTEGKYREFADRMLAGLSGSPQAKARELCLRLKSSLRNDQSLTFTEFNSLSKRQREERILPKDLEAAAKRGSTNNAGMFLMYYRLLNETRIPCRIVMVVDRNRFEFRPTMPCLAQLSDLIFRIPEEGKPDVLVDPAFRFAPADLLIPAYQGTKGLELDPQTWKTGVLELAAQGPAYNQESFTYRVALEESGDAFQMEGTFQGYPAYRVRSAHVGLDPRDLGKRMKSLLEGGRKGVQVLEATADQLEDLRKPPRWNARGTVEQDDAELRKVNPFPLVPLPLDLPDALPDKRMDRIFLPMAGLFQAESILEFKPGWTPRVPEPITQDNSFGSLQWHCEALPDEGGRKRLRVVRKIEIARIQAPASMYAVLREFMEWIRQLDQRRITFTREGQ